MSELLKKQVDGVTKMKIPGVTQAHEKVAKKMKENKLMFYHLKTRPALYKNGGTDLSELWDIDSQWIEGTSTIVAGDLESRRWFLVRGRTNERH